MRAFRRFRYIALLPMMLWLMAQFAMSGVLAGPSSAALNAARAGTADQIVTLCTPDGFRLVALDESGQPVPSDDGGATCDWCQSFGSSVIPVPLSDSDAISRASSCRLAPPLEPQTSRGSAASGSYVSRAPPLVN